jgi:hypothetical protein
MKKIFVFSLIVVLIVIFWACSDDSNPVTSAVGPRVFDPFTLWDTASTRLGSSVLCLAVKDSFLFAGTSDSGVFRSTNSGDSWTKVISGLTTNLCVNALLVKDSNVFAGTNTNGIYQSTNNGTLWTSTGVTGLPVYSFVQKDSNLFAGSSTEVYLSTDKGSTWVTAGTIDAQVRGLAVRGSRLFAATYSGVNRSADNGSNWIPINGGMAMAYRANHSIAVRDTNLFVATDGGIFRSANDSTWKLINEGLHSVLATSNPQSIYVAYSNIFAGFSNYNGVYLSLNNGAGWISANSGLPGFSAYAFLYNGSYLFVGGQNQFGGGGVWRHPL